MTPQAFALTLTANGVIASSRKAQPCTSSRSKLLRKPIARGN